MVEALARIGLEESERVERIEKKNEKQVRVGDVLAEVKMVVAQLEAGVGDLDLEYVWWNEMTAATEAVTDGHIWITRQRWNRQVGDFEAFGEEITPMMERGVSQVDGLMGYDWELERGRRGVELDENFNLRGEYYLDNLEDKAVVMISPYPEEMSLGFATKRSYDPEKKRAMVRVHKVDGAGNKQIIQIGLDNSSTEAFRRLLEKMGVETAERLGSTEVMALSVAMLVDKESGWASVVELARQYDVVLEEMARERGQAKRYFLGKEVGLVERDYEGLERKREFVEGEIAPFVDSLVDFDVELAQSLVTGKPVGLVADRVWRYLTPTKMGGEERFLVSDEERKVLRLGLVGKFGEEAAQILKEKEMVRVWTVMSTLVNGERAEQVLGASQAQVIAEGARRGRWLGGEMDEYVDRVVVSSGVRYFTCAGDFGGYDYGVGYGGYGLNGLGLGEVGGVLWGEKKPWEYHKGECRVCKRKTDVGPCNICKRCEKKYDARRMAA